VLVGVPDRSLHEHDGHRGAGAGGRARDDEREPSPFRIKRRRDLPGRERARRRRMAWVIGGDERDGPPLPAGKGGRRGEAPPATWAGGTD
jgi:hypothetical protein